MTSTDLKKHLEIEFKAPRNYIPLADPSPTAIEITPEMGVKGSGKKEKKKTTKTKKKAMKKK